MSNHYEWLEQNLQTAFAALGINHNNGIISAHGDKCYTYQDKWSKAGIPFNHGVVLYLLTYISPWSESCRTVKNANTGIKWISPCDWVIDMYPQLKDKLPPS